MYVPRGYERLYNGRRMAPLPPLANYNRQGALWGTQPAGQSVTTVGDVAANAAVPIVLLGLAGLAIGAIGAWKFVRRKGWGR